ncbi:MAG: hypothetical protein H6R25_2781 [Proteobacteria bacterium]|nr:hypothetical protein [Pseudomonadota bacterium]
MHTQLFVTMGLLILTTQFITKRLKKFSLSTLTVNIYFLVIKKWGAPLLSFLAS